MRTDDLAFMSAADLSGAIRAKRRDRLPAFRDYAEPLEP